MSGDGTLTLPRTPDGDPVSPGRTYYGQDGVPWEVVAVGEGYAWAWQRDGDYPTAWAAGTPLKRLRPEWLSAADSWGLWRERAGALVKACESKEARHLIERALELSGGGE